MFYKIIDDLNVNPKVTIMCIGQKITNVQNIFNDVLYGWIPLQMCVFGESMDALWRQASSFPQSLWGGYSCLPLRSSFVHHPPFPSIIANRQEKDPAWSLSSNLLSDSGVYVRDEREGGLAPETACVL